MHAREMGVKGVNKKGIQIFEFEMMIHVIHTRTKIDLSNIHTHKNSRTSMLFYMYIMIYKYNDLKILRLNSKKINQIMFY